MFSQFSLVYLLDHLNNLFTDLALGHLTTLMEVFLFKLCIIINYIKAYLEKNSSKPGAKNPEYAINITLISKVQNNAKVLNMYVYTEWSK